MDFRKRTKELCQVQGITQKELAEKMGITDISLNKTLRGEYPQLQTLEKIAISLNVPIAELFEKSDCRDEDDVTLVCPKCGTKFKMVEE